MCCRSRAFVESVCARLAAAPSIRRSSARAAMSALDRSSGCPPYQPHHSSCLPFHFSLPKNGCESARGAELRPWHLQVPALPKLGDDLRPDDSPHHLHVTTRTKHWVTPGTAGHRRAARRCHRPPTFAPASCRGARQRQRHHVPQATRPRWPRSSRERSAQSWPRTS
jgi:hypothetical protein